MQIQKKQQLIQLLFDNSIQKFCLKNSPGQKVHTLPRCNTSHQASGLDPSTPLDLKT